METSASTAAAAGYDPNRPIDALFVNAPLRDYTLRPRVNDFTLPVLGMAYIATYAARQGFNVGIIDAEAHGLGITETQTLINRLRPRWVGFNLLAPTYPLSARIAEGLAEDIKIMVGGHQAKALPDRILLDPRFARLEALILGEGEPRVAELLADHHRRAGLPGVLWRDRLLNTPGLGRGDKTSAWLAPDINALPFIDRAYLAEDPRRAEDGRVEANMVGARGCPYDCAFCGAAVSANPDITIRTRDPHNIIQEMTHLRDEDGVTAFRFVDDLFLGHQRFIRACMAAFAAEHIGEWAKWDATGRINILHRASDDLLDTLVANGLREVALGVESGSERVLAHMDKRITPEMTRSIVSRLTERGIGVKGYFILGFPTETRQELDETVAHVRELWEVTDRMPGWFRASVFEFRPYPGTPEWHRLMATGHYTQAQLLAYADVDLTGDGLDEAMRGRDEFNFTVDIQFGGAPLAYLRQQLVTLAREQHQRRPAAVRTTADPDPNRPRAGSMDNGPGPST